MAVTTNYGVPIDGSTGSTLMPKLQYRFRVTFANLGFSTATQVSRNVISVSRPALDHDDLTIDVYNSKIRLAGKHTWQDVSLVLRDDVDSEVIAAIGQQLNKQVDHGAQSSAKAGQGYKFTTIIETLDGGNDGTETVLDKWELVGCFIPSVQYGDLNYATSEQVQVTVTLRYDNASNEVNGADKLSAGNVSLAGNAATN